MYRGERVLLKRQVDDIELATAKPMIARMVFDEVDDYLTFPPKRMGSVTLFNGIDVEQTRDYIKISVETYLERVCEKHMNGWMTLGESGGHADGPADHEENDDPWDQGTPGVADID